MAQLIFINLPVLNLARSRAFYAALGFGFNEQFSDDKTACVVLSDEIHLMLLTHARFSDFCTRPIADSTITVSHLLAFSRDSREAVDDITQKALAAGGIETREATDYGFMYGRSFADPDGHIWEPMWMDMDAANAHQAETGSKP